MKTTLLLLGLILPVVLFGQQKHGQALIDSLQTALSRSKADSNKVKLLASLAFAYYPIDPDTGIKYGKEGMALAEKINWLRGVSLSSNSVGVNYESKSNYPEALNYFQKSLQINEKLNDRTGIAHNLGNIGIIYGAQSHFPKALDYFFRSVKINEELGNISSLSNNYGNIGNIYLSQNEYDKALVYYRKALEICEGLKDSASIADNLAVMGSIYVNKGQYTVALDYFSRSLRMEEAFGNKAAIAFVLNGIGTVYLRTEDYQHCLEYHLKAVKINEEISNQKSIADNLGDIGICYLEIGKSTKKIKQTVFIPTGKEANIKKAIDYFTKAVAKFKEIGDLNDLQKYAKYLSEAQALSGNYKDALSSYIQYEQLRDSVFSEPNKVELTNLETKRHIDLKDKDILIKNKQLEIEKLEKENKRKQNIILIAGVVLLLVIIVLVLRNLYKERRLTKAKLSSNEHRFRALIEHSSDAKTIIDLDGKPSFVSESIKTVLGYEVAEIMQMNFFSLLHPDSLLPIKNIIAQVIEKPGMNIKGYVGQMMHKDGAWRWIEAVTTNLLHDSAINGIVYNFRDITERKIAEERFRLVVESAPNAMVLVNKEGKITLVNGQAERLFGFSREELINFPVEILIPFRFKEKHPGYRNSFFDAPKARSMGAGRDLFAKRKDGTDIPVEIGLNPLQTSEGPMVLAAVIDITERKIAEEKLMASNRLYTFISAINQAIVHIRDQQSVFNEACRIASENGKFKEAWIGLLNFETKTINLVAEKGLLSEDVQLYANVPYENNNVITHILKNGTYYLCNDVELMESPSWKSFAKARGIGSFINLPIKKNGAVIGIFNLTVPQANYFDEKELALLVEASGDISFALDVFEKEKQQEKAEENVRHSEKRLKEAQAIAHFGNWELNFATGLAMWSEEACRIYGLMPGDNLQSYDSWLSFIHPGDLEYVMKVAEEGQRTLSSSAFSHRIVRRDGTIRHIYTLSEIEFKDGMPVGLYGVVHDVTEQKIAEEEKMKVVADIVQRNKDLEQFSYIVSHNLRLPVANIIGLSNLLQIMDPDDPEEEILMKGLATSAEKLDMVIKDLNHILQVRNQVSEQLETIIFKDLLTDIELSIRNLLQDEHVRIVSNFEVGRMQSIRTYLYSIFFNLISNSIKYRQPEQTPVIEITSKLNNGLLELVFIDNGLGIDLVKRKQQIFGLYKRFHNHVEGKGMGLYMVKTQVETLGGKIFVESEVNKGTTFTIIFEQF